MQAQYIADNFKRLIETDYSKWKGIFLSYAVRIVIAIIILSLGFWLINRFIRSMSLFLSNRRVDITVNRFLKNLANVLLKAFLIVYLLNFIGFKTSSFIAIIGAAGLAIGLALQGTLTNFAGGVMLLLFRPFRVGDTIEAQGKKGVVREIQIFSTIIHSAEEKTIIIPNSLLSNGIIEIQKKPLQSANQL